MEFLTALTVSDVSDGATLYQTLTIDMAHAALGMAAGLLVWIAPALWVVAFMGLSIWIGKEVFGDMVNGAPAWDSAKDLGLGCLGYFGAQAAAKRGRA